MHMRTREPTSLDESRIGKLGCCNNLLACQEILSLFTDVPIKDAVKNQYEQARDVGLPEEG